MRTRATSAVAFLIAFAPAGTARKREHVALAELPFSVGRAHGRPAALGVALEAQGTDAAPIRNVVPHLAHAA